MGRPEAGILGGVWPGRELPSVYLGGCWGGRQAPPAFTISKIWVIFVFFDILCSLMVLIAELMALIGSVMAELMVLSVNWPLPWR